MVPSILRVAAVQMLTRPNDARTVDAILERMREARAAGCAIAAFHEGALTGYPGEADVRAIDFERLAAAEQRIQDLARELGLAVLVGSCSRDDAGRLLNDVLLVDTDGQRVGRYAKTWRASEPWYAAGTGPVVFTLAGVAATVIVCHDLRYPELVRLPVLAGARVLFIINNESGITHERKLLGYRSMQIARATENDIFAVMANAPADPDAVDGRHQSHGNSKIVDPLGNVLDEGGVFEERLVLADLDLSQAGAEPPLRTIGQAGRLQALYGPEPEHAAYAHWINEGLEMVQRLPRGEPRQDS